MALFKPKPILHVKVLTPIKDGELQKIHETLKKQIKGYQILTTYQMDAEIVK